MENKKIIAILSVLIIVVVIIWGKGLLVPASAMDYKNATYSVENQLVTLVNGVSEVETAPGSVSKTVTRYFGDEVFGDLNNDGKDDVVFLITQNSGGSGTFYYVVAALKTGNGYTGTNAILLGDRIAPQNIVIQGHTVVANYADRTVDEPMTAQPSVGKSKYLTVQNGRLIELSAQQ